MKTAGIRELKQNASAVVAEVVAGEVVTITDRGRPVARLVPIRSESLTSLVESGRARPARRRISELGPPPRLGAGERPLSDVLEEMRQGERW
jgi:prevent-host-death family protein